jgi:hypothetical protein
MLRRVTVGLLLLGLAGTTMGAESCSTEGGYGDSTASDTSAAERKAERRREKRRAKKRREREKRRLEELRVGSPDPAPETVPEPESEPRDDCHPSYEGACLDPNASDYDCEGGSGDGPEYVAGPIRVVGDDPYGLDSGGTPGVACES